MKGRRWAPGFWEHHAPERQAGWPKGRLLFLAPSERHQPARCCPFLPAPWAWSWTSMHKVMLGCPLHTEVWWDIWGYWPLNQ